MQCRESVLCAMRIDKPRRQCLIQVKVCSACGYTLHAPVRRHAHRDHRVIKAEAIMSKLEWNEDFVLGVDAMDQTHVEFVDLLARVEAADDAHLLEEWQHLIDHTDVHFDNENRWMLATRFAASNCHTTHHGAVLGVMREGLEYGRKGHLKVVRQMATELANWFPQHADTMDAALALHLRRVGYDPVTGAMTHPEMLPHDMIHGCGGDTCTEDSQDQATQPPVTA